MEYEDCRTFVPIFPMETLKNGPQNSRTLSLPELTVVELLTVHSHLF